MRLIIPASFVSPCPASGTPLPVLSCRRLYGALALHPRAMHVAEIPAGVELGSGVQCAAIVPDQHVTHAPFVAIDEALLGRELDELVDQVEAFRVRHADDASDRAGADPERFAPVGPLAAH